MSYLIVRSVSAAPCRGHLEPVMDAAKLKRLLISVTRLTPGQKAELLKALNAIGKNAAVCLLVESRPIEARFCLHGDCSRIVRSGSANGLQRYKCWACHRTFNALSTTPLAGLRMQAKRLRQQEVLLQGLSVSQALGTRIHGDAILCTDGSAAMAAAAVEVRAHHEPLKLHGGERLRGPWQIQNVNAYHSSLKSWIAWFRSVATD